jgi:hypothetical protein
MKVRFFGLFKTFFPLLAFIVLIALPSGCSRQSLPSQTPSPKTLLQRKRTDPPYQQLISLNWIGDRLDTLKSLFEVEKARFMIAEGQDCGFYPVQEKVQGRLTSFWAQELIGADLALDYLTHFTKTRTVRTPNVAIFDFGPMFKSLPLHKQSYPGPLLSLCTPSQRGMLNQADYLHGSAVANLIFGPTPIGVSYNATPGVLADSSKDSVLGNLTTLLEAQNAHHGHYHDLVNISLMSVGSNHNREFFSDVQKKLQGFNNQPHHATIPVFASGNTNKARLDLNGFIDHLHEDAIFVGSISPIGVPSDFSQEPDRTTVFAPSDFFLQTLAGDDRQPYVFSGTSGATPLVTAALANVKSIISELTTAQAAILLKKSSTPLTPALVHHGPAPLPLVNAYKLVRVANRMQKARWDDLSPSQKDAMLKNPALYNFQSEASQTLKTALQKLTLLETEIRQDPHAFNLGVNPEKRAAFCQTLAKILQNLRKSFLLDPTTDAQKFLAVLYAQLEFPLNSAFYQSVGSRPDVESVVNQAIASTTPAIAQAALLASPDVFAVDQVIKYIRKIMTVWSAGQSTEPFNAPLDILQPVTKIKQLPLIQDILTIQENKGLSTPKALWVATIKIGEAGAQFALNAFQTNKTSMSKIASVFNSIPRKDRILPYVLSVLPLDNPLFSACVTSIICNRIQEFETQACQENFQKYGACMTFLSPPLAHPAQHFARFSYWRKASFNSRKTLAQKNPHTHQPMHSHLSTTHH